MSAIAWPAVALVLGLVLLWRLDAFSRRWEVAKGFGETLTTLVTWLKDMRDNQLPSKADAKDLAEVREMLTRLSNRMGPPK